MHIKNCSHLRGSFKVYSSVNVEDSEQMKTMTNAAVIDSAGESLRLTP